MKHYMLGDFLAYVELLQNKNIPLSTAIDEFEKAMSELGVENLTNLDYNLNIENETSDFDY